MYLDALYQLVQHTWREFPCAGVLADGGDKHICHLLTVAIFQFGFQLFDLFLNLVLFLVISLYHVEIENILPLTQLHAVTEDIFGGEPPVFRQGNEHQMHVRRLFIHMHHGGHDIFPFDVMGQKGNHAFEERPDFLLLHVFEKLRTGGDEGIHQPGAVLPGAASRRCNPSINLLSVTTLWADNVKIVFAAGYVDIRVTFVLRFTALMVGFQRVGGAALVLGKALNSILFSSVASSAMKFVMAIRFFETYRRVERAFRSRKFQFGLG
jgi:hypothetical protein